MTKKFLMALALAALATFAIGCSTTGHEADNANTTRTAADGSEITTTTDASGVKTETRVFRNNPRVSRVVVTTTPDNRRTVRVYSPGGEEREVNDVEDALEVSADKLADAAGFVADKGEDVVDESADKLEDVGDKAKTVGDKTVQGAKIVGKKTTEGAKKTGKAIKDAVTP